MPSGICLLKVPKLFGFTCLLPTFRLEYEQKRDMDSRITKLESSLSALRNDLQEVIAKEKELKSAMEKATDAIDHLKEEVKGMFSAPHDIMQMCMF